jgi:hypothetical protein
VYERYREWREMNKRVEERGGRDTHTHRERERERERQPLPIFFFKRNFTHDLYQASLHPIA